MFRKSMWILLILTALTLGSTGIAFAEGDGQILDAPCVDVHPLHGGLIAHFLTLLILGSAW